MKLTLSAGGGYTGQTKEYSITLGSLDETTRQALFEYMAANAHRKPANYNDAWSLDDGREVIVDADSLPASLRDLYTGMKAKLKY